MDIKAFNAAQAYGTAQKTLRPEAKAPANADGGSKDGFEAATKMVKQMGEAVAGGEKASADFMAGKADPHSVVEALASAEVAVETAVTLRNRVVEAYQELLRMPI